MSIDMFSIDTLISQNQMIYVFHLGPYLYLFFFCLFVSLILGYFIFVGLRDIWDRCFVNYGCKLKRWFHYVSSGVFFKAQDILLKLLFSWTSLFFQVVCPFLFGSLRFFCLFFCLFVGSMLALALAFRLSFLS